MAQASYRRNVRTAFGATRRYYAKVRKPGSDFWLTAGSADTEAQRDALVARVQARYPERELVVVDTAATLDLSTMNSGAEVVINTPLNVRRMAVAIRAAGAVPEIELFDSGDVALMHDLLRDGTLAGPVLCSFVLGVKYGFQPSPETVLYARDLLPPGAEFTVIGTGRWCFPMVAQSVLAGGHVRVGLEDAVFLDRGVLAPSNAAMVERARRIVEDLGARVATPARARDILGLAPATPAAA